jgi:hypothetical protein
MPRNPRLPEEGYADPVSYWAVQGGAGWLNILRQQQEGGLIFPDQQERDLVFLHTVLARIIAHNRGLVGPGLPGGASGAIARHFPIKGG